MKHHHQGERFRFLRAQKEKAFFHQEKVLKSAINFRRGQKKTHEAQKGDWKFLIDNKKLPSLERHNRVRQIAENLEKNALRREYIIK